MSQGVPEWVKLGISIVWPDGRVLRVLSSAAGTDARFLCSPPMRVRPMSQRIGCAAQVCDVTRPATHEAVRQWKEDIDNKVSHPSRGGSRAHAHARIWISIPIPTYIDMYTDVYISTYLCVSVLISIPVKTYIDISVYIIARHRQQRESPPRAATGCCANRAATAAATCLACCNKQFACCNAVGTMGSIRTASTTYKAATLRHATLRHATLQRQA